MFLRKKKIQIGLKFCTFRVSDIDLAQITLGQDYETPSHNKQPLCEKRNLNVTEKGRYGPDTNFALFLSVTMTLLL